MIDFRVFFDLLWQNIIGLAAKAVGDTDVMLTKSLFSPQNDFKPDRFRRIE